MVEKGVFRIIDANMNRAKEGLRVVEDIFRFIMDDDGLRRKARMLRHSLDSLKSVTIAGKAMNDRNSLADPGRELDAYERVRRDAADVLYSNFQRIKESLRVLEEFFKLVQPRQVRDVKRMRYAVYRLEQQAYQIMPFAAKARRRR